MKMQKRLRGLVLAGVMTFAVFTAYAESISISTYYPSPYGSYQNLDVTDTANFATTAGKNVSIGILNSATAKLYVQDAQTVGIMYKKTGSKDARIMVGDPTKNWSMAVGWGTAGDLSFIEENTSGNRLYIQRTTGKVGLSTSTPAYMLHVQRSAGGIPFIGFSENNGSNSGQLNVVYSGGSYYTYAVYAP